LVMWAGFQLLQS